MVDAEDYREEECHWGNISVCVCVKGGLGIERKRESRESDRGRERVKSERAIESGERG